MRFLWLLLLVVSIIAIVNGYRGGARDAASNYNILLRESGVTK